MSRPAVRAATEPTIRPAQKDADPVASDLHRIDDVFERQSANRFAVAATTARQRIAKLRRLLEWVRSHQDEIRQAGYADFKKPAPEVDLAEILPVISEAKHTIRHLKRWMRPRRVWPTLALLTTRAQIRYEAKGVVLIIAPWNYPFTLSIGPLISAVAAGNCVCIKPSEMTPRMSEIIRRLVSELFEEDEVAVFEGEVEVSSALLEKPFHHIFFTGSPQVGKIVMRAAAEHLATVTLELGGKSPTIVDETADLGDAAHKISWGKFINNGQTCIAPDYLLVHESRYEAFRDALGQQIRKAYGDTPESRRSSPDYARIVNGRHHRRLVRMLERTRELGAEVELGGEADEGDCYLEPTLLSNVDPASPAMQEEIFGPILPMVPYSTLDEAISIINAKDKPLALYMFSRSRKNIEAVLSGTSAGGSCINDVALQFLHLNLPFGGINNSGIGSSHGVFGFKAFSHERAVLRHNRYSVIKLMTAPYGKLARRLIALTIKYL